MNTYVTGAVIKRLREERALTQSQLAGMIGATNTTVSNWEKGLSRPDADMIQKLCEALGLQPNYFYGTPETENAPAPEGRRAVSDDDIKFALFGGDGEITDAMFDEVKRFAAFIRHRESGKKE